MNLGMPEMIFIFLMALMVFGPRKLPELARSLGKAMAEFKRASNEFKYQLESEINAMDVQENQAKRQDLTGTILPPERAIPNTQPAEPVTVHAPGASDVDQPKVGEQLDSLPMNKEPNA